jgi:hypothetical protein
MHLRVGWLLSGFAELFPILYGVLNSLVYAYLNQSETQHSRYAHRPVRTDTPCWVSLLLFHLKRLDLTVKLSDVFDLPDPIYPTHEKNVCCRLAVERIRKKVFDFKVIICSMFSAGPYQSETQHSRLTHRRV